MTVVSRPKGCASGTHRFLISEWRSGPGYERANSYTCQHCLMLIEGDNLVKQTRCALHADGDAVQVVETNNSGFIAKDIG